MSSRANTLVIVIALMWVVHFLRVVLPGSVVYGIIPRTAEGLAGIVMAPFLHMNLQHLWSNTIPLAILGAVVLLRGSNQFLSIFAMTALFSGFGTWIFGSRGMHIGASGVVFGLAGFLIFRGLFERTFAALVIAIVIAVAYWQMILIGLVPQEGIGWAGHFFGFVGGAVAARTHAGTRGLRRRSVM
ncbi:MAG TPA: rhomboid family intramembrane serine protease [Thermoanaerobaculia bacterium]|jgi:membrane associated rhomboid family serine protease